MLFSSSVGFSGRHSRHGRNFRYVVTVARMENMIPSLLGIMGGLLVFAGMLLSGLRLVHWLGLEQEPPLSAQTFPPAPPMRELSARAGAPAVAALQARRTQLYQRAMPLRAGNDAKQAAAATAILADLSLEPAALDRADHALTALGA